MKVFFTSVFLLVVTFFNSSAQLAIKWQQSYGGSFDDQVGDDSNYYDAPDQAIVKADDGGFVMIGWTNSNNGPFLMNQGSNDFAIIKVDSLGNLLWSNTYGGSGSDMATSIVKTNDGGYAIVGFSDQAGDDVMLVKIDSVGVLNWQKFYGGTYTDRAYSLAVAPDGGFYIGANSSSSDGDHQSIGNGNADFWLIKTDSLGNLNWEKSYGGTGDEWMNSMKICSDSGIVMAGFTLSNDGDVTLNNGSIDYWVVKVDTVGNLVWEKTFGGSGNDWAFSIIQTTDGGYAVAGLTESNDGMVTGWHGGHDYWVLKLDAQGSMVWQKDLGGSLIDECYDILETPDNGFLIAGTSNSYDGDFTHNYGLLDFSVMKVNSSGSLEYSNTFGGSQTDWGMSIIADGNGDYLLAGSSKSTNFDMSTNAGGWDFSLLKLTPAFNSITGKVYFDNNNNLVYDAGDFPVTHHIVHDTITGLIGFTDQNGNYQINTIDTGSFTVSAAPLNYHILLPASRTVNFSGIGRVDSLNDFTAIASPGYYDLSVSLIPLNRFRPGFPVDYLLTINNVGTDSATGTITVVLDPFLIFTSASIPPDSINGDTLIWFGINYSPQQPQTITISTTVDVNAFIGSTVFTQASIYPTFTFTDSELSNNVSSWTANVTGSFDPNDKAVSIDKLYTDQLSNLPYLDYIIRFQNTGNDTAFTVVVRDTISALINMSSFSFVNSSHPATIDYQSLNRLLAFTFSNIQLADSNANESMSHGYVHFKVKPNATLVNGDLIENTARIYFDFNQAVITNTAVTQVLLPTRINPMSDFNFSIYPNPTTDHLKISIDEKYYSFNKTIEVINSLGEIVLSKIEKSNLKNIDLNVQNLPTGLYFIRVIVKDQIASGQFVIGK